MQVPGACRPVRPSGTLCATRHVSIQEPSSVSMKAIRKPGAAPGLVLCDAPVPEIRSRDVLIKVRRAGVCGTGLHIRQ